MDNNVKENVKEDYTFDEESKNCKDCEELKKENKNLKQKVSSVKSKLIQKEMTLELLKEEPNMVCKVIDSIEDSKVIIKVANGNKFLVNSVAKEEIKPGDQVIADKKNLNVLEKLDSSSNLEVKQFVIIDKPEIEWNEIGGLKEKIEEVKEVVEEPLNNPDKFRKMGIKPPKGILLHGPPGNGKTMIAKAVAKETNATFIELIGSELVQKFIGEGAKLVKKVFELARKNSPTILFIDEIDSIASKRVEIGTSGEREVQRTFMQLLGEIDGFKPLSDVKVIGATNRLDILDRAVIRPGRLDRLIKITPPDTDEKRKEIIKIHSKDMPLEKEINFDLISSESEGFSGAEISAMCTEAGYFALREDRDKINEKDFLNGVKRVRRKEKEDQSYKLIYG